ncbi:endonuclease VII domain-containing protein [Bailinhaonella thermotolerans]|uniref:Recombination endonuclease VII n=1 Tax=Bailinhaonella thermotolerans TaxID=1070861 RepID=A0A3A4BAN6_9ACTN|nr:endonuclease VII domain-containing protein [Bailinhaonella thermotolerans]RJL35989.1 hypothetical protein D5H75_04305 [Bailinhaonella thermotolerans]
MSDFLEVEGKRCPDCGELKSASAFGQNKRMPDGLARYCKECFRKRSRASYRKRMAAAGKAVREPVDAPAGHKFCPACKETKTLDSFGNNRANKSGKADYCRPCHNRIMAEQRERKYGGGRNYQLKRRYGLDEADVERMVRDQMGVCAICFNAPPTHVDHDHATGEVRRVLCFNCNNGLGHFKDDPEWLTRAAEYLLGGRDATAPGGQPYRRGAHAPTRTYHLRGRYGMTAEDVDLLIERQGGVCAVCGLRPPEHVDHEHSTGWVRAALCSPCNTGLGQFRDRPEYLSRAAAYVRGEFYQPTQGELDWFHAPRYDDWAYESDLVRR